MATMFQMRYDVLKVDGLDSDDEGRSKKGKKKQNNAQPKQQQNNNKQQQQGGKQQQQPKQQQNQKQQQQPNKQQQQQKQQQPNKQQNGKGNNQNVPNKSADSNKTGGKQTNKQANKNEKKENQRWDDWVKADQMNTNEAYEKDLHKALLASKVEYEKAAQEVVENEATSPSESQSEKKKKKKSAKPVAMNLQEFREGDTKEKTTPSKKKSESSPEALPLRLHPEGEANPNFFDDVDADADKMIHIGKAYDEYQKQFAQESVRVQKLEDRIKRRDNEISMLKTSLQKKEEDYQQVKKRNKQLCCILAQGEMKEKADILIQSDSLSQVNTELTEQVTELTGDLEKERSKVHSLETEIERLKTATRHPTTK